MPTPLNVCLLFGLRVTPVVVSIAPVTSELNPLATLSAATCAASELNPVLTASDKDSKLGSALPNAERSRSAPDPPFCKAFAAADPITFKSTFVYSTLS